MAKMSDTPWLNQEPEKISLRHLGLDHIISMQRLSLKKRCSHSANDDHTL